MAGVYIVGCDLLNQLVYSSPWYIVKAYIFVQRKFANDQALTVFRIACGNEVGQIKFCLDPHKGLGWPSTKNWENFKLSIDNTHQRKICYISSHSVDW